MTPSLLLDALTTFVKECTKDLRLPVRSKQTEKPELTLRAPTVYKMDLPSKEDDLKLAPFIVVQLLPGEDTFDPGDDPRSTVQVRFVTVCYCDNMSEGKMYVLNVIERLREGILKNLVIADHFALASDAKVEWVVNPNPPASYFDGEIFTKFEIPPIVQEFDNGYSAGNVLRSEMIDREDEMRCPVRR